MVGIIWKALSEPGTADCPSVPGACCLSGITRERDRRLSRLLREQRRRPAFFMQAPEALELRPNAGEERPASFGL